MGLLTRGQQFGARYQIISLLGIGGMGEVYRAWDSELGLGVALKVVRPDVMADRGDAARLEKQFKNELVLARQVTHKNVVRIHDLGEIDGVKYITMPYVEGQDLATVIKMQGPLGLSRSLALARQTVAGLEAAHEAAVVHRDLKPANIMVTADDQALIMDFGIARSTSGADGAAAGIAGTLAYMAPEQARSGEVDQRADIYAFGLILYEMLVGRQRLSAQNDALADVQAYLDKGVPPLRTVDPAIPEPVVALVSKCLERDPVDRYQTSTELAAALARLDDDGNLIPEPRRLTPRLAAAAAVLIVAMAAGTYVIGRRAAPTGPVQHEAMPVLIADFVNRSGDPTLEGAVEQTLLLALQGASYVRVLPIGNAHALAAQLAADKSTRVTPEMGQLIARREGLKVLITGSIDKQSAGFRLRANAVDPATGNVIGSATEDAKDRTRVLSAVGSIATTLREAFGESKTEMAKLAAAETVTAGSVDAMRAYSAAQEFLDRGQYPEAIAEYQKAVVLDPNMGRAYAGMAVAYRNVKQADNAKAAYSRAIALTDRMTEREKYRTLGGYYFTVDRNFEKAIENYEALFKLFPADNVGLANLAFAHLMTANVQRALMFGKQALDADLQSPYKRYNVAMYAMYASDFEASKAQAPILLKDDPKFHLAWLPFAQSTLSLGDVSGARDAYEKMATLGEAGASLAAMGQADVDLYLGRSAAAVATLTAAIPIDEKNKDLAGAAAKWVALADAYEALGEKKQAAAAAKSAVQLSQDEAILFPAAGVLIRAGQEDQAEIIARSLAKMLQTQTTADADLIRGEIAMQHGDLAMALEDFRAAQKRYNSWYSHYLLGTAYMRAEHFSEALTEFETCVKRRGEVNDVFFADSPTLRYLPPAYYGVARSQQAMGVKAGAKSSYEQFIKVRAGAEPADPLVADARARLASLAP